MGAPGAQGGPKGVIGFYVDRGLMGALKRTWGLLGTHGGNWVMVLLILGSS